MAEEVAPGIFRIKQLLIFKQMKFAVNIYVLTGKNGLVFDSGFGNRQAGKKLVEGINHILETVRLRGEACDIKNAMASHGHWDHFSGLAYLQKTLGLDILATEQQAPKIKSKQVYKKLFWGKSERIRRTASQRFSALKEIWISMTKEVYMAMLKIKFVPQGITLIDGNTRFTINEETWEVISLPGHCDDDVVLYNQKKGILLSGDLILNRVTTWLGPSKSNLEKYLNSLEFIQNLPNLKLILPAHGSPITNPRKRLQEAIGHRQKRTRDLFQLIVDSGNLGISFEKIFRHFYPKSKRIMGNVLRGWIIVTLEHLLDRGEIIFTTKRRDIIFTAANASPAR